MARSARSSAAALLGQAQARGPRASARSARARRTWAIIQSTRSSGVRSAEHHLGRLVEGVGADLVAEHGERVGAQHVAAPGRPGELLAW